RSRHSSGKCRTQPSIPHFGSSASRRPKRVSVSSTTSHASTIVISRTRSESRGSRRRRASVAPELFVDTSGWYVLALPSASQHRKASEALRNRVQRGARVVTTNLVIAETHALLLRRTSRKVALTFVREVR